jgi:hypothetical protein
MRPTDLFDDHPFCKDAVAKRRMVAHHGSVSYGSGNPMRLYVSAKCLAR